MAISITHLVLAALFLASASAIKWENLWLRFGLLDGYFPIKFTLTELLNSDSNWVFMAEDTELNVKFYSYLEDPRVSIGFDSNGNIAAVRSSYIKSDLDIKAKKNNLTFPYDFSSKPMYSNGTFWSTEVFYTTVLFQSPETLKAGGTSGTTTELKNLYVKINGEYTEMPKKESKAESLGFTEQACFIEMGKHYFLGMTTDADCNDLQGVFLLYESEELIGMGLIPFGSFTTDTLTQRTWFEDPSSSVAKIISPHSPACLTEWTNNYGLIGLHFFFKAHPRLTFCL